MTPGAVPGVRTGACEPVGPVGQITNRSRNVGTRPDRRRPAPDGGTTVSAGTWTRGVAEVLSERENRRLHEIEVQLRCEVSYAGLGLIGLPGAVSVDASSAAPLDPYRSYQ